MRTKNKRLDVGPGRDLEWLKAMQEDYTAIGFDTELSDGTLTIFSKRQKKETKKDDDKRKTGRRR